MPSPSRRASAFAGLLTLCLGASLLAVAPASADRRAFIEKPVLAAQGRTSALVHVFADHDIHEGIAAARAAGADIGTRYDVINVFVAYGTSATFRAIATHPSIEAIEANRRVRSFSDSSHKATRGQDVLDGAIRATDGSILDGTGIGVAVVDSGVDGTHPDLENRMGGNVKIVCSTPQPVATSLTGFTECLGPKTAVPLQDTDHPSLGGHGTHVAGTVAGDGTASNGLYHGAAPGATLYGVSVGTLLLVENGLDGLAWVLANHDQVTPAIRVVNNSWGSGHREYDPENAPFHKATWKLQDALIADGVTLVWAAGNAGGNGTRSTIGAECVNPTPGLVCVANYDDGNSGTRDGSIDSSSSRGASEDPVDWPDVSAPGTQIMATCRLTLPVCNAHLTPDMAHPNLYAELSGTSMASPHVAGIVAQVLQANPTLSPAQVEDILEDTAYKFQWGSAYSGDPYNPDDSTSFEKGHGLVDVVEAVRVAMGGTVEPEPTASTDPTTSPTSDPSGAKAPSKRYYFHSGWLNNQADFVFGSNTFDEEAPTLTFFDAHAIDTPAIGSAGWPFDPEWEGVINGRINDLTVDFWANSTGEPTGEVRFVTSIYVDGKEYRMPVLVKRVPAQVSSGPVHVTHTFTTMLDLAATPVTEVPLDIPADGEVSIVVRSGSNAHGVVIRYENATYNSGFSVNTVQPSPTPTETAPPATSTDLQFTDDSAVTVQHSDTARIAATLTTTDGVPLTGKEIAFELLGTDRTWTAVTGDDGVAGGPVTFSEPPGSYRVIARYAGENGNYLPTAADSGFVIAKDDSETTLEVLGNRNSRSLRATVTDADSATGLSGVVVAFVADGGIELGSATTDQSGVAAVDVAKKYTKKETFYEASFGGSDMYLGSSDRRQV